jgi:outer membrane protein W
MRVRPALIAAAFLLAPLPIAAQGYSWQAVVRIGDVRTHDRSSVLPSTAAALDIQSGGGIELAIGYTFRPEWALELSFERAGLDVDATAQASNFKAGDATLGVTALTLQHRFFVVGRIRPYIGVGAHLASISGFKASQQLVANSVSGIGFSRSASLTAQAGLDYDVTERISINGDVKFHDVGVDATLMLPTGEPWQRLRVDVDPWVLALGVGFRF